MCVVVYDLVRLYSSTPAVGEVEEVRLKTILMINKITCFSYSRSDQLKPIGFAEISLFIHYFNYQGTEVCKLQITVLFKVMFKSPRMYLNFTSIYRI